MKEKKEKTTKRKKTVNKREDWIRKTRRNGWKKMKREKKKRKM